MTAVAGRHLLLGLLGLQNGLINQGQLLAAFQDWTLDKSKRLADYLEARGDLTRAKRALLEALAEVHLEAHGGDVEQSLAAVSAGESTRESLARLADPDIEATLGHVASGHGSTVGGEVDRTTCYAVGAATSAGQRFRVLRPHARGGLGAVFVALDGELHREVALKQILDQHADDPTSRQRFLLEAEVTGGLEHPSIVPVYGLGTYSDGRPYYAMRFIRGDSLKEAIDRFHADLALETDPGRRSLELRNLLRRFTDVCNAIDYAHSRGVLHRDIKPGNVIVGKHGETLVVDWGLAKATGRAEPGAEERTLIPSSASGSVETLSGSALGTPAYMSPEQASGDLEHLGPRSDVYSLGATLYCLLTGKPPLQEDGIAELIRKAQRGEFTPPRQIDPSIDRALEAVCLKAMARKPEDRYATPRLLAEDIERWTADEPVTAWREPVSRRLLRWLTRHRTGMTAAGAALLVALAGTGAVLAVQTRANADLKLANSDLAIANFKVTKANADLQAAIERERARFTVAMEAIKTFHTGVSKDILLKEKAFVGLRRKLLQGAADFYRKLETRLRDQPDRNSRFALSDAYSELANLTQEIGSQERALVLYRQSFELRKTLAAEPDAPSSDGLDLAHGLLDLGRAHQRIGELEPARAAFEESLKLINQLPSDIDSKRGADHFARCHWNLAAVEIDASRPDRAIAADTKASMIQQQLVDEYPNDLALMVDLVNTDLSTGYNLIAYLSKPTDALVYLERARLLQERVVTSQPDDPLYLRILAECSSLIGLVQLELGSADSALVALNRAQTILRKLVEKNPNVTMFQNFLAGDLVNIGNAYTRVGDRQKSLEAHTAARETLAKLVAADPSAVKYQRDLAAAINNIGDVQLALGRISEALEAYSQARALLERLVKAHPDTQPFLQGLAFSLAGQGRARLKQGAVAAGVADLRESSAIWDRLTLSTNESLYAFAGNHALVAAMARIAGAGVSLAEAELEARRAVECLRKPLTAGYRSIAELRADPDLRALAGHRGFEDMLLDLQFPKEPFKRRGDAR